MTRQPKNRARDSASAKTAFVLAVKQRLPPEAFERLRREIPEEPCAWAKRLNLNAQCVIDEAESIARLAREHFFSDGDDVEVDRAVPDPEPVAWLEELGRVDALPRSITRQSVSDRVARDYLSDYRSRQLVDDAEVLAPLSANPRRESRQHFLRRALDHFEARKLLLNRTAKRFGFPAE
jgi:hypothetical protein